MKKKKITAIIVLIIAAIELCVCTISFVNAFFIDQSSISSETRPTLSVSDDASETVAISTEIDLIKQSRDTSENSGEPLSSASGVSSLETNRKTLRLANDLTLTGDLIITADCHINLNGFNLYLNGHTVTVSHGYSGTFVISNGNICADSESDKIYIDTPNAVVVTNVAVIMNGSAQTTGDFIEILSYDEKWLAYNIFYKVAETLADEKNDVNDRMTYAELHSYFTVDANSDGNPDNTDFSELHFLPERQMCPYHGSDPYPYYCAYVFNDLDLFKNYYGYDTVITYTSGNENVLSDSGAVTPTADTVETTTLTVTLKDAETQTVFAQKTFDIHVVSPSNNAACAEIGKIEILDYLYPRYGSVDTDGDGINDWNGYIINGEILLPAYFTDFDATVMYETYDGSEPRVKLDESANFTGGTTVAGQFRQETPNMYVFAIDTSVKYLKIIVTSGESVSEIELPVRGAATAVKDNYTIAQSIVREWYGLNLKIYNATSGDTTAVNNYTTKILHTDVSQYASDGVTGVSYSLVNNTDGIYAIGDSGADKLLFVAEGQNPDQLLTVFVKMTFSFGAESVDISLPVIYTPDNETGNSQIHPFLPYYIYFNRIFFTETGANTYETFEMEFNYSAAFPVVCFDIGGDEDGAVSLILYYNGTEHALSLGENESYTASLDALLAAESLSLQDVINYGDAKWIIKIDTDEIGFTDRKIDLIYNYKFSVTETTWSTYDTTSEFTLTGIVRCVFKDGATVDSDGMPDTTLYKWVYDNYNLGEDVYDYSADKTSKFILTSWLAKDVTIDNTNNVIGITNYKGFELLDGTKTLILKNSAVPLAAMQYIADMESLENLDLSSNGLYDRASANTGFPTGDDNQFINTLSALGNLKILDLSDNLIYSFEYLTNFTSLTDVYTYGNTFTANMGWSSMNDLLEDIVNSIYGSSGTNNISVYQTLYEERGVRVYYLNAGSYYAGGSTLSDRDKLKCIVYQDKLPAGASIEDAYSHLSVTPSDYGIIISESETCRKVPINPDDTSQGYYDFIVFSYDGDATTATSFTVTFWYQNRYDTGLFSYEWVTISVQVTFNVTRIG